MVSLLSACGTKDIPAEQPATPKTRVVKDGKGNDITIPYEVTKVAPLIGAFAQITEMLTNGSGKIVAAAVASDFFKEVFPDYVKSNPKNLNSTNLEDLIASGAQVAYGPASIYSDEQRASLKAAGIVFIEISSFSTVQGMIDSFEIIGNILGEKEAARAKEFGMYYKASIDDAAKRTAGIAEEDKVKVLMVNFAADVYSTVNSKDIFSSIVTAAGGINVAADYSGSANGTAMTADSEQIVEWNPDVIITRSPAGTEAVLKDPALAGVTAVENGKVYTSPRGLYLWGVRSGENAMMTPWLGQILYPELFADIDMNKIVSDFFKKWYNYTVDNAKIAEIISGVLK
ncbi:MAG: ABC transporter substrate-binding protein [Clostridiaceae bacterium]|nr:ABC transporter substrate-binding protein [Clostridiaceae bacterium]